MNTAESSFGRIDETRAKLQIDGQPDDAFAVLSFEGKEEISANFVYEITVESSAEVATKLDDALGRNANFATWRTSDETSTHMIYGMVQEVRPSGVAIGTTQRKTVLRVVPRLYELCHKQRCQVFQNQTVVDIARELFKTWSINVTDGRLSPAPLKRDYCTQVNERDFDFLLRILSEEGIHFYFEQDDQKGEEVVTLINKAEYLPINGTTNRILYNDKGGAVTNEHINSIVRERRVRPGAVAYRDYNFLRPTWGMLALNKMAPVQDDMGTREEREIYEYPGYYNHPDGESLEGVPDDMQGPRRSGLDRAQLRLEEQRSDALTFSGETNCLRMQVGRVFEMSNHPDQIFNRKYVVTRLELCGRGANAPALEQGGATSSGTGISVKFWAVPEETPIRPRVKPKPKAHLRIARVVGPNENEPNIDKYGRIKIQFAWDRERDLGAADSNASCWVRMMTPAAHHTQGTYIPHRVGAEVLVDFLDGDVDRPVVIGALFNEDNHQPRTVPDDATRSVVYRGISVPVGDNWGRFNEISCEDKVGHEEIYVHAQKDLNERILNCHSESIGVNQASTIGKNQTVKVGKDQTITVGPGNRTVTVHGNEKIRVDDSRTEHVTGGEFVEISLIREHRIGAHDLLTIMGGNRMVSVAFEHNIKSKSRIEKVETTIDVKAGTSIHLHHNDDAHLQLEAGVARLRAETGVLVAGEPGPVTVIGKSVFLVASDEIRMQCGGSILSLKNDGTITINGSKAVDLICGNSKLNLAQATASMSAAKVTVGATNLTTIGGGLIRIG
ncbi:MAG: type VI secretion system tip protein VgrG [Polyangiaceae bacterium]|nr:type VI secretion system tip protein VgrG [Polyangiaceae bacterium]